MGETAKATLFSVHAEGKPKGVFVGVLVRQMLMRRIHWGAEGGGEIELITRDGAIAISATS